MCRLCIGAQQWREGRMVSVQHKAGVRRTRSRLAGVAVAPAGIIGCAALDATRAQAKPPSQPVDLGSNVKIFDPSMSIDHIQSVVDAVAAEQVPNQFGEQRYALLFKPGVYGTPEHPLRFQVGYYTEVAGLGRNPGDVTINGSVNVYNQCDAGGCIALNNFWRSMSNLRINAAGGSGCQTNTKFWAVSQAAPLRRVDIHGTTSLMDYCSAGPQYASGGY